MDTKEIEQQLLSRPLPDLLPADEGWLLPHYDGLSIANLPATVARLLGSDLPGALPPLPTELWYDWQAGLQRVVLVVLDAWGYRLLQKMWAAGEGHSFAALTEAGRLIPLTSVFPSTTDAALVSLSTGRPPAEHGWLAYTMYLREWGMVINAIVLCPIWTHQSDLLVEWGMEAEQLVTAPTLAQQLNADGIASGAIISAFFKKSGFTRMLYRGVKEDQLHGHFHSSDLWARLRHLLAATRGQKAFISAYWSGLDTIAHAYGPFTDPWETEFRHVNYGLGDFLQHLPAEDREGTLLLITADHGQIYIPQDQVVTAAKEPELNRHLWAPITGESRAAFIYPRPGRKETLLHYLDEAYPGWFEAVDSVQALEAGLMGQPIADETYSRAGEILILPRGNHALQHKPSTLPLIGRHGGLTPDEMLVPLIGVRLEALS